MVIVLLRHFKQTQDSTIYKAMNALFLKRNNIFRIYGNFCFLEMVLRKKAGLDQDLGQVQLTYFSNTFMPPLCHVILDWTVCLFVYE